VFAILIDEVAMYRTFDSSALRDIVRLHGYPPFGVLYMSGTWSATPAWVKENGDREKIKEVTISNWMPAPERYEMMLYQFLGDTTDEGVKF